VLDWKDATTTADTAPVRGIVRRPATVDAFRRCQFWAGSELAPWIAGFWSVEWDLGDAPPVESVVISAPAMHLTIEWGTPGEVRHGHELPAALLHGVVSTVFSQQLHGCGGVIGVRFRPGGFAAWTGLGASRFTDQVVPASQLFGGSLDALAPTMSQVAEGDRPVLLRRELLGLGGWDCRPDAELGELIQRIDDDETLVRVEQLVELTGWSSRTVQRRFRDQVGIGPKWVLARSRLQQAALALEQDPDTDLAKLAARLGWYDQAHLTNDFRRMLGETPGQYAARARQ
jgi:AraC-like DNA-binding protein